jgi:heat shock protein HtpX
MHNTKVFVLLAGLTALFVALGGAVGGSAGALLMAGVSAAINLAMYWGSSTMVLRAYGARVVTAADAPALYATVDRLRQRAGLPMPTVAIAPQAQPNAFATGRNPEHAVVCVTEGLLGVMGGDELEGVIAHELAHIKNRDMLLSTIAATMAGAISAIANVVTWGAMFGGGHADDEDGSPAAALAMAVVAPIAAMVIQMAISRQREFKADAVGAEITGRPLGLARALQTLEVGAHRIPMQVSPAMAPLAQVNPLAFSGGGVAKLFSTHPPTAERVAALERMAAGEARAA